MEKRIGSMIGPNYIGQSDSRRQDIERKLFEDFKPRDVLEEIWLSDIAAITGAIEYYRYMETEINCQTVMTVPYNLDKYDLVRISYVVDIINNYRRERERIYNQFEKKRRPIVESVVKSVEVTDQNLPPQKDLAD